MSSVDDETVDARMEMITTCPHCATSFRVSPDHLRARAGKVRCGRCAQVFDGLAALTTREAAKPVAPAAHVPVSMPAHPAPVPDPVPEAQIKAAPEEIPTPEVASPPAPSEANVEPVIAPLPPAAEPVPDIPLQAEASAVTQIDIELLRTQDITVGAITTPAAASVAVEETPVPREAEPVAAATQDIYERLTPAATDSSAGGTSAAPVVPATVYTPLTRPAEPEYPLEPEAEPPRRRSGLWAFAALLALIALAGQAAHIYRNELAAKIPALKPALMQLCEYTGCKVSALQRPEALKIEASDLQVVDPAKPTVIQLTATLRNYSSTEVGYPTLDLVLTDNREHALVRRMFAPADYLPRADTANAGIAANAEFTVRIDMDVGGVSAAGFRLNLTRYVNN